MVLKLFNSLGRELQAFVPINAGEVRMYTCGPTVWNYAHIGNFRTFVFQDVLRRHLEFKGYKVTQVMNITDVEDKIIKGIRETGKSLRELTDFYTSAFIEDLDALRIERPERLARATEHMDAMLALIRTLRDRGLAYRSADGSWYFAVSKFKAYGALSGVKLGSQRSAGRVSADHYEAKKGAADFAVWKAWVPDDGGVFWETEFGKGRPGWSLECSAMSMKYLGDTFDIHTGGIDLRFPHHENEIAQSESATGKKFVNYWLHAEFLGIGGAEMHKSAGNFVTFRELRKDGWDPLTIRLFLMSARYRDPIDLTAKALEQARSQRARVQELVSRLRAPASGAGKGSGAPDAFLRDFESAMDDDLNTPKAISALLAFVRESNALADSGRLGAEGGASVLGALERANSVLGVIDFGEDALEPELRDLLTRRDEARKRKDFAESDRLRKELLAAGVVVEDAPGGTRWKRAGRG
ncbi:MAG: cysteine--tRNA ligase [Nitrososphaerota archaeon]|nr:cysteine--tRNA ligase [Nitrososphaerota archaeon]